MLLHLIPRFYLCYSDVHVDVVDVFIPELGLTLKGDKDIILRTPYKNKKYKVVCRKKGRKAIEGIFVETDKFLSDYTVVTRWAVNGGISTHTIHYHVFDSDFDAATDSVTLWNGYFNTPYETRLNSERMKGLNSAKDQPRMVTFPRDNESERIDDMYNVSGSDGIIRERTEYIEIPTVERDRLAVPFWGNTRIPAIDDSFSAVVTDYPLTLLQSDFNELGIHIVPLFDWIRDLKNAYQADTNFLLVLEEINNKCEFFYSNTNDLLNKALSFSSSYAEFSDYHKSDIRYQLMQPIFHVFVDEEKDQ